MKKRYALMLGNRILGISKLMKAGQNSTAQEQVERLKLNIDLSVIEQYTKVILAAQKAYTENDTEMLDIIGNGVIDNLINKGK